MIRFHTLRRKQSVSRPLDQVFAFFFRRAESGGSDAAMAGIPVYWRTEILRSEPPFRFVDVGRKGPHRLWHHTHRFDVVDGGTLLNNTVRYRLPFGILGRLVNTLKMRRDVDKIFDYRSQRSGELFATANPAD
jgi:ligand-binding SRPBCC domain-containing protein